MPIKYIKYKSIEETTSFLFYSFGKEGVELYLNSEEDSLINMLIPVKRSNTGGSLNEILEQEFSWIVSKMYT